MFKPSRIEDLLAKMRSQDLSESERAELGELAKRDRFVAEALEGINEVDKASLRASLTKTHDMINKRSGSAVRRKLYWPAAAAILAILIVSAWWLVQDQGLDNSNATLADGTAIQPPTQLETASTSLRSEGSTAEEQAAEDVNSNRSIARKSARSENADQPSTDQQAPHPNAMKRKESATSKMIAPGTQKNVGPGNAQGYALAVPTNGWDAYYSYIRQNIAIPLSATENELEGSVYLEFNLDTSGKPTEIRVVDSLSPDCDAEAKRLVLEGPVWDVVNAQVPIARLKVDF